MGLWFANPVMLVGLGAMLLPLVVHMISRLWYRRVNWGAMMFLPGSPARSQWKKRCVQWGLITIRMGIIACICLAMAGPAWRAPLAAAGSPGLTVLVIDHSGSMALDEQGRSRAELAQEAALAVMNSLPTGQQVSLIFTGDDPGDTQPSSDLQAVASRLAQKIETFSTADLGRSLQLAADVFEQHGPGRRDLYLITDGQAINWKTVNPVWVRNWQQLRPVDSHAGRFSVITLGTHQPENSSIDQLIAVNPPAVVGLPLEIQVRITNHGPGTRTAVPLRLWSGQQLLREQSINLAPESSTTVRLSVNLPGDAEQILRAELAHDRLPADDSMERAISPRPPLEVLLISDRSQTDNDRTEQNFVPAALAPFAQSSRQGADLARVRTGGVDSLITGGLDQYAAVILANVHELSWPQVQAIEQYAYNGGGVLIAPGNQLNLRNFNDRLWRQGAGIAPAKLLPATSSDGSQATGLLRPSGPWELPDFVLRTDWDLPLLAIGRYFPIESPSSQSRTLIQLRDGRPYLLAQQVGRGRVMLLTSPLDADWNLLPATRFYLELLQSSLRWLAGGNVLDPNLQVGQELSREVDPAVLGAEVFGPLGWRPMSAQILRAGNRVMIRSGPIRPSGTYRLRIRTPAGSSWSQWVVQPDRAESDLRDLEADRWLELSRQLGFSRVRLGLDSLENVLGNEQDVIEFWGPLLTMALLLLALEMWFTRGDGSARSRGIWRVLRDRVGQLVHRISHDAQDASGRIDGARTEQSAGFTSPNASSGGASAPGESPAIAPAGDRRPAWEIAASRETRS